MNPISTARYLSGTAMLAVATAFGLFATRLRFRVTACAFLAGMLLIFPLADAFRYSGQAELKSTNPIQSLLSADFDSFAQLMNGYLVAARDGIVPGKQFSGVLLFWVPRTLWTAQTVDTGEYIANGRGYCFTNLSAPLWIEFYLNGGWLLLAVGMFALGFALHRWDTRLNAQLDLDRMPGLVGCILPFYLMILLRGSLSAGRSLPVLAFWRSQLSFRSERSRRRDLVRPTSSPNYCPGWAAKQRGPIMSARNTLRGARRAINVTVVAVLASIVVGLAYYGLRSTEPPHGQAEPRDVAPLASMMFDYKPTLLVVGDSYRHHVSRFGRRQNGLEPGPRWPRRDRLRPRRRQVTALGASRSLIASMPMRRPITSTTFSSTAVEMTLANRRSRWWRQPMSTSGRFAPTGRRPRSSSCFPPPPRRMRQQTIPPWRTDFAARPKAWARTLSIPWRRAGIATSM